MNMNEKIEYIKIKNLTGFTKYFDKNKVTTGFEKLDNGIGGLKKGRVYCVSSRPVAGKTSFVCNVALNSARANKNVLFINLADSNKTLIKRLIGIENNLSISKLGDYVKYNEENDEYKKAIETINNYNIFIDNMYEIKQIYFLCKALYLKKTLDLVIIDGVHLLSALDFQVESKTMEYQIIYGLIKKIAEAFEVPVLITSQLILPKNRKKITDKDIKVNRESVDTSFILEKVDDKLVLSVHYLDKTDSLDDYMFVLDKETCRIKEIIE